MSRSLIVLPDDSARPILDAINSAEKSIRVKMFVFSDPELLKAIVAAHHRSVKVQIMLNPARRDGKEENQESRQLLRKAGVDVIDSNPAFDLTHEKSTV
jgi:cardiolipin synthase